MLKQAMEQFEHLFRACFFLKTEFLKSCNFAVHIGATAVSPLAHMVTCVTLNPENTPWFISWGIWLRLGCSCGVINGKCPKRLHKHGQSCQITAQAAIKEAYVVVSMVSDLDSS